MHVMKKAHGRSPGSASVLCVLLMVILFCFHPVRAESITDSVMTFQFKQPFEQAYQSLYQALEEARFYVIFEANIGNNLARNAERWGEDYNRNGFEHIKSLLICNPWYANQALNRDPAYMGMCPLSVGIVHKDGLNTVYFRKLSIEGDESAAAELLWEVENTIVSAIESVVEAAD